ncbi:hypothetical protein EAO27_01885 [Sphingopyxis sp. YF1]|jgi:hypothetical protein|nr:hypothetical protein EAO27_01885 [Sphingopyxis sp. YF1]
MIAAGALASMALLLAAPDTLPVVSPAAAAAAVPGFAPPLGQPLTYRVTTRRAGRSGSMLSFTLVYALQWQEAGRGYRLDATLRRIESDARPEVVRGLTGLLRPIVGETVSYLVGGDGRNVALADPETLWARVGQRTQDLAAAAQEPEARRVAELLTRLPAGERDRLVTADIRALVAPANAAIPRVAGGGVSIRSDGAVQIIVATERGEPVADAPLGIETHWSIDSRTGLVLGERRQSWIDSPDGARRTLAEERIRALSTGDPG